MITTSQVIYVYAGTSGCSDENQFDIQIGTPPTADDLADVNACTSYTLPALSAGNSYYTQTNAGGTQLNAGDMITTSQVIYVYAGTSGCSDENQFDIQIGTPPTANDPADVNACESYTLPQLSTGNYFTQPNGTGSQLFPGDNINVTQTLYVYSENEQCSVENSFSITISSEFCEDTDTDQNASCTIDFPNFFTPNNDGINDFYVPIIESCSPNGTLTIFDRYGKLIYQTNRLDNYWNGTFNGKPLPSSDFWYRFENLENQEIIKGHFSLLR